MTRGEEPNPRREFFRDILRPVRSLRARAPRPVFRPPWALPEDEFLSTCERCGACVETCHLNSIEPGAAFMPGGEGFPVLFVNRSPCDHCGECADACPSGAIQPGLAPREANMGTARVLTDRCVLGEGEACRACVEACPFPDEAVSIRPGFFPHVDPDVCTGCGLCVEPCPGSAIHVVPS